jgi:NAD(P)-dependent dehydrogenase (short-subunit alcohol dehydrogenase family)
MSAAGHPPLRGKRALVTGAGSGIGRALAIALAAAGAEVSLLGRTAASLKATGKLCTESNTDCWPVDLTDTAGIEKFVSEFARAHPAVHILVHAAGAFTRARVEVQHSDEARNLLVTNALAPFTLTSALLPLLRAAAGDVVLINSSIALRGGPGVAAYSMSKAAMHAFAESLRSEENAAGLRVLSVYLGRTATPMQQRVALAEGVAYEPERLLRPEDVASTVIGALTLPRGAEITDIHIRPRVAPKQV